MTPRPMPRRALGRLRAPTRERVEELYRREEELSQALGAALLEGAGETELRRLREDRREIRDQIEDLLTAARLAGLRPDGPTRLRDLLEVDSRPLVGLRGPA